jgi:hypothetical protein
MPVLHADPWNPEFGMGYDAALEDSPLPRADPFVESTDWSRPLSASSAGPEPVWFVDGVRRVDLRILADEGERRVPGLFGSYAVGAVRCDGAAAFDRHRVCRAVIVAGGMRQDGVDVRCGAGSLMFEPATASRSDPNAPLDKLQELMRVAEQNLSAELIGSGVPLVLADGPLRLGEEVAERGAPVVGVVKRFVRQYLEPAEEALLARLGPGDRTPVFALLDREDAVRGYSWYARLVELRPPWHDHAGVVRCEVRAGVGLEQAVRLAERVTALLPSYAGRPSDPRAPQNLAPVAALEEWLKHRMGHRWLVRRALLTYLLGGEG